MGRMKSPGLFKRNGIWHIDKQVDGYRFRESASTADLAEAEKYLAKRTEDIRQAAIYGVRPSRTFRQAATKYLRENLHKSSAPTEALYLKQLDPFIGDIPLDKIHNGILLPFIQSRQAEGRKTKTINLALGTVRHLLNLAASEWMDDNGLTWLVHAPKIKLLPVLDAKKPYPLSREEQERLFAELPLHLRRMALFKVNTGCREQEVCRLLWEWEVSVPELDIQKCIIKGTFN